MKSIASSRFATVYASARLLVIAVLLARSPDDPHRTSRCMQPAVMAVGIVCGQPRRSGSVRRARGGEAMSWWIRGTYFESCNCDAICPCRRIDGAGGGRSTHGVCMGVLSWLIEDGAAGGADVAGGVDRGGRGRGRGRGGPAGRAGVPVQRRRAALAVDVDPVSRRARLGGP